MIEQIGTEIASTEDIQHWRQRRIPSSKTAVHVHDHCSLKICQEFCSSWFFIGTCFAGVGITCMVAAVQNLKLDICNWIIWIGYVISTLSLIIGVALMGRASAKLIRVIISECRKVYDLEVLLSESSTEYYNPSFFVDEPQSSSHTPRAPEVQGGQMTVYADVHRSQDSSDRAESNSLCNFAKSDSSSVDDSSNAHSATQEEPGKSNSVMEGLSNGEVSGNPEL